MPDLRKGYWVHLLPAERCDGLLGIHFLARRTYTIPVDNVVLEPMADDAQPPFLDQDRCDEGKPEVAPPTLELELVAEKARVDIIVVGKTYAPGGKALKEWQCAVRIGSREQRLRILGPRKCLYVPPQKRENKLIPQPPKFTEPEPIKDLLLSFCNAYGGRTRMIPDDESLKLQRSVNEQFAKENAADDAKKAEVAAAKKAEAEVKAKDAKEKELFESLGAAAKKKHKAEKLKLGDGSEGFDADGVRLWNASASKDGTAVLDLEEFDKQQLAEMAREDREAHEAAEKLAREGADTERKLRKNAAGEWIEVDDDVEILTDDKLAKELAQNRTEQEAAAQELAESARLRAKETVVANDGTRVMDAMGDEPPDDTWPADLRERMDAGDVSARAEWTKRVAELKKAEEEKVKEFPELPCPTNPFGKGFAVCHHEWVIKRLELPQIEDPAVPLTPNDIVRDIMELEKVPLPAGFSTYPRQARPRADMCGPLPSAAKDWPKQVEATKRGLDLENPDDVRLLKQLDSMDALAPMRPGFFNSATPTMQWHELTGDEEITLTNLTKDGTLFFKLPGKVLEAELDRGRGIERLPLRLDTMIIEPDTRTVTLLWRTHYPLPAWADYGDYPHLVGWVLDLDVKEKKDRDWAERLRAAQGEGTAVLDISNLDAELEKMRAEGEAAAPVVDPLPVGDGTQALEIDKMGTYRVVQDDGWVKKASDGTVDVTADEKAKKAEDAYVAKKTAAIKALEAQDKKDKDRREEIATAVQADKPVPPKDGPPGKTAPPPPPPPKKKKSAK